MGKKENEPQLCAVEKREHGVPKRIQFQFSSWPGFGLVEFVSRIIMGRRQTNCLTSSIWQREQKTERPVNFENNDTNFVVTVEYMSYDFSDLQYLFFKRYWRNFLVRVCRLLQSYFCVFLYLRTSHKIKTC